MAPDKKCNPAREEFEVAFYTKELGRPLQRKLLQRQLDDFTDSAISAASHGDEPSADSSRPLPREDRAG